LEEVICHTPRITVAFLTAGKVKALRCTLVAFDPHEVWKAGAVAVVVAGETAGAEAVAGAHLAVGIAVVAGGAGVAAPSPVVAEAWTLPAHLFAHTRIGALG